ncbi:MAG: sigma-70 family RNA polymerase sigma factor [Verrucomicrobiota bacterium]
MGKKEEDASFDTDIIERLLREDGSALEALYDRYARPLYSLALKMLGDEGEAEEVIQDVFTSVWRKTSSFRPERAKLFTWMTALTRNRCIDRLRSRQRRLPKQVGEGSEEVDVRTAVDDLFAREQADQVRSAIRTLPPDQRRAIQLAFFQGYTYSEVSQMLGIPLGTAKSRIRYAISRLRTELEKEEER